MSNPFLAGMNFTPTAAPNPFASAGFSGGVETLVGLGGEAMTDTLGRGTVMDGGVDGGLGGVNDGRSKNESRALGQELALVDQDEKPEVHLLVFVQDLPDIKICCGVVSSGQGVKRFCLHAVIEGTDRCGTGTH
jgi:hypothetical protein